MMREDQAARGMCLNQKRGLYDAMLVGSVKVEHMPNTLENPFFLISKSTHELL